ncbi:MAG: helicase-associated domain-containing protein [Microbacteriaceae bacterium]|nr:helicase-associated domain-containing protein [Microbacteriaceae bacterium]
MPTAELQLARTLDSLSVAELTAMLQLRKTRINQATTIELASHLLKPDTLKFALEYITHPMLRAITGSDALHLLQNTETKFLKLLGLLGTSLTNSSVQLEPVRAAALKVLAKLTKANEQTGQTDSDETDDDASDTNVAEILTSLLSGDADESAQIAALNPPNTRDWWTNGFTAVNQATAIMQRCQKSPGKLTKQCTTSMATLRELSESLKSDHTLVAGLLYVMQRSGLLSSSYEQVILAPTTPFDQALLLPQHLDVWMSHDHASRWLLLARAALLQAPQHLLAWLLANCENTSITDETDLAERYLKKYPLHSVENRNLLRNAITLLNHLGLVYKNRITATAQQIICGNFEAALQQLHSVFPPVQDQIIIQPDLSIIAPYPLHGECESLLWACAQTEQIGVATTFIINRATLNNALQQGYTIAGIRNILRKHSLTGLPQPLEYMLNSFGEYSRTVYLRQARNENNKFTEITVPNAEVARSILANHELASLHLRLAEPLPKLTSLTLEEMARGGGRTGKDSADPAAQNEEVVLLSPLDATHVHSIFTAAHYSFMAKPGEIDSFPCPADQTKNPAKPTKKLPTVWAEIDISALHHSAYLGSYAASLELATNLKNETQTSRLERLLEHAINSSLSVRIEVENMREKRSFVLQPRALANGRLRAIDLEQEVERTLPLSAITKYEMVTE